MTAGTVVESPPDASDIDPRLRARRIAVRRDEGRRRLRRLGILAGIACVVLLSVVVTRSPVLDVDRVVVVGASHTSVADVQAATGIRRHTAMVDVNLDRARRGVSDLPWIRTVSVQRSWPATIKVVVSERAAVAVVPAGPAGFALVDGDGRVLETAAAPPSGYVMLANVATPGPPGSSIDAGAADALAVARSLDDSLRARVSTVVVDGDGVTLRLGEGGVVRLGPATEIETKLRNAETVLADADTGNLCALDVRVPSAPSLTRGRGCL